MQFPFPDTQENVEALPEQIEESPQEPVEAELEAEWQAETEPLAVAEELEDIVEAVPIAEAAQLTPEDVTTGVESGVVFQMDIGG